MADPFFDVIAVYTGSDGAATQALYARVSAWGPSGVLAVNLLRAAKTSERAKKYRGGNHAGSFRSQAYERKRWAMGNLSDCLTEFGESLEVVWGWKEDPRQPVYRWVLYVDLPTGQVSFHSDYRGKGPDYPGEWDCHRNVQSSRICRWIANMTAERQGEPR